MTLCDSQRTAAPVPRSGWTCREAVCRRRDRRRRRGVAAARCRTAAPTVCLSSLYDAAAASSSTDWQRLPPAAWLTAHSCRPRNSQTVRLRCTVTVYCLVFTFYYLSLLCTMVYHDYSGGGGGGGGRKTNKDPNLDKETQLSEILWSRGPVWL